MTAAGEPRPPTPPPRRSGGAILAHGCWLHFAATFVASLSATLMAGLLGSSGADLARVPVLWLLAQAGAFFGGFVLVAFVGPAVAAARRRRRDAPPPA